VYSKTLDIEFDATTFHGGLLPAGLKAGPVPIDMGAALLMLGSITVPNGFSVASPAAHWAWVRYFSALGPQPDLRVTTPFSDLDPHQVGILSDDFGVAVTTQWLFGQVKGFKQVVDGRRFILQYAHLLTQAAPQPAKIGSGKSPDFVVLDNAGKWHVLECKGTQTTRRQSLYQLDRARQQKQAIEINSALAGLSLAAGLFLASEGSHERSRMMVHDPSDVSRLIKLDDNNMALNAAKRITAARSLGLAGFTYLAEELNFVDTKNEALRKLLTVAELRRGTQPPLERRAIAFHELQSDRASLQIDKQEYIGREFSTEVPIPHLAYETRRVTVKHGVQRDYFEKLRSTSPNTLFESIEAESAESSGNDDMEIRSDEQSVIIRQGNHFVSSLLFG
jgi:hypothetical protein